MGLPKPELIQRSRDAWRCWRSVAAHNRSEASNGEIADGCVVEHKAPQIIAIEPGHDGWVVGDEPVVIIEFDFEGDTVRRTGMPSVHRH